MKHLNLLSASILLLSPSLLHAAPNDMFLQANSLSGKTQPLNVDVAIDAVNKTIDLFDVRAKEGATSENAGDYLGGHIVGKYQLYPNLELEAGFWQREIDYSKDTNKLQSWLVATTYTPNLNLQKNDFLDLRFSLWGNYADQLKKTTPTTINNRTFNYVRVNDPSDIQLQVDAIFSRKLDPMNQLNAYVSTGYSKVKVDSLKTQAKYQGCLVNLNINKNNHYTGSLAEPCQIDNAIINELNISGSASDFNLDVDKDLNYDAYYAAIGGSWNWRYQQFESQLAYQYQRLWRSDIDDRVNHFGNSALKDNHTFSARFSYDVTPNITPFVEGYLFKRNFVGNIPFLYNGVTASRLDRKYGYASLGVNFHY
ncbi:hypothetical protein [Acinetobacter sp. XH1639]|uniref:hypothetical protein n=1 Tax=Acinetobacter sp. XH1639 TaxID=3157368 RepID=UPI0032B45C19